MAVATVQSVAGQGVVGQHISCPWLDPAGPYEITQGWGSTQVQSEPAEDRQGKHFSHWHAGVDLSSGSITSARLVMPAGLTGKAVYLNNPGGYGTALIVQIGGPTSVGRGQTQTVRTNDIYFGHLASRHVKNGATVRGGDFLATPDSTGNSTGPHLHLEVRPPNGRYGTDEDPSSWALGGQPGGLSIPNPLDPIGQAITQAEQSVMNTVVGLAQTALGGTMMLAGGATIGFGLRGMSGKQALGVTRRTAGGLSRRRSEFDLSRQRREPTVQVSDAGRTRLRPSLRRELPSAAPPPAPKAPVAPRTRAEARGLVPTRYGVPIRGREAARLRRGLPLK